MPKASKVVYVCSSCGYQLGTWIGKCPECNEWNTIQEQVSVAKGFGSKSKILKPEKIIDVKAEKRAPRLKTSINDINEVLGGGIVPGSVILLAGQPGIGKSTILMQIADSLAGDNNILYISGEESAEQVSLRASRLGANADKLMVSSSNSTDDIAATILSCEYKLVVVDSIQTISCQDVASAQGSVSQITNSTHILTNVAKNTGTALIIVGHVTKDGSIAGPKLLEHMVDVVMNIEGDRYGGFKVIRSIKNRYGSTDVSAIFEMGDRGLQVVPNPSAELLKEREVTDGSIVLATMEGTRPVLVEVQALVNSSIYGYPKRAASGFDSNRLNLLVAVLEKRTKLTLSDKDIYINIVGGLKIQDPAADLAVCMAIGSAAKGLTLKTDAVVFGEVGLSGEVRHVSNYELRVKEAIKLGFKQVIGPKKSKPADELSTVSNLKEALNKYLG